MINMAPKNGTTGVELTRAAASQPLMRGARHWRDSRLQRVAVALSSCWLALSSTPREHPVSGNGAHKDRPNRESESRDAAKLTTEPTPLDAVSQQRFPAGGIDADWHPPEVENHEESGLQTVTLRRKLQGSNSEQAARVWVIRNAVTMPEGWRIAEFRFFEDEGCTRGLDHDTLRQGPENTLAGTAPPRADTASCGYSGNHGPSKSVDGFENTFWVAPCCPCNTLEGHVGADFGSPVVVMCARIVQALAPYAASEITLSKEGTTIGISGNLWVDLATWTGLGPGTSIEVSGINSGPTSITYEVISGQHCGGFIFGQEYTDLQYAKNACVSNPSCGAVYEQACQDLEYDVIITNTNDLAALTTAMVTVTVPPARPGGVQESRTIIGQSALIGDTTLVKDSEYAAGPPPTSAAAIFPFPVKLKVKPKYGAIRTCVRGYQPTNSPEGSCLHVKRGALLEFTVFSNFGASDSYIIPNGAVYTDTAAKCAELCLQVTICNAFTYTIRENGNPPTVISCRMLQMPPNLQPPLGLLPADGVLDVVDFYKREQHVNATMNTLTETTDAQSDAPRRTSGTVYALSLAGGTLTLSALLL
ncbi:unnamed protein product [Amoebophrya sp. A25]|nr:unnamed protein product [Amoebophrya sp. A25]|eukprot:GSA25T00002117001.1